MIRRYLEQALRRAEYQQLEDNSFCATVPGLRGVIATGTRLEACREELAEVIEAWILVRVSRGLPIPALDGERIVVRKAS